MALDGNKVQIVLAVKDEATGQLKEAEKRFVGSLSRMSQETSVLDSSLSMVKSGLAALGVTIGMAGIAALAKDMFDAAVKAESLDKTFKAISGSSTGARAQIAYLRSESQRLGLDFQNASEAYKGLLAAARDTALSDAQTKQVFTSIAEASTVLGLSADQTQGALLSLTQMLSKGKVQAEELRGQLGERLPGAFNIAAKAMGMTTAELDKALQDGKVYAEDFLPKFAKAMHEKFGKAAAESADSAASGINRFNNAWNELKVAVGQSFLMDAASTSMNWLKVKIQDTQNFMKDLETIRPGEGYFGNLRMQAEIWLKHAKFIAAQTRDIFETEKPSYKGPAVQLGVAEFEQINMDASAASFEKLGNQIEKVRGELNQLYKEKRKLADEDFYTQLTPDQRSNFDYSPSLETAEEIQKRLNQLRGDDKELGKEIYGLEEKRAELLRQMESMDLSVDMDSYVQARDAVYAIDNALVVWQEQLGKVRAEIDIVAEARTAKIDLEISNKEKEIREYEDMFWALSQPIWVNLDTNQALQNLNAVKAKLLEIQQLSSMMFTINVLGAMSPARPFSETYSNLINKLGSIPGGMQYQIDFLMGAGGMDASSAAGIAQQFAALQKSQATLSQAYRELDAYRHSYNGLSFGSQAMESYYENTVIPKLMADVNARNATLMANMAGALESGGSAGGSSYGGGGGTSNNSVNINTVNINITGSGNARSDGQTAAIEFDTTVAALIKNKQSKIPAALEALNSR